MPGLTDGREGTGDGSAPWVPSDRSVGYYLQWRIDERGFRSVTEVLRECRTSGTWQTERCLTSHGGMRLMISLS